MNTRNDLITKARIYFGETEKDANTFEWMADFALSVMPTWIPVATLPEEDGMYLCTMDVGVLAIVRFYADSGRWNISAYKPTHWQPLPTPAEVSE